MRLWRKTTIQRHNKKLQVTNELEVQKNQRTKSRIWTFGPLDIWIFWLLTYIINYGKILILFRIKTKIKRITL